jgi:hypothetical protein
MDAKAEVQVESQDVATLDASLKAEDWPLIQRLWRAGVSNESIYQLLRLRLSYRNGGRKAMGPHMDGFVPDGRARFARWLVQQGRLNEGLEADEA